MNAAPAPADRRLIEEWLPVNELSVEAIREGGALAGHPPVNQLHVWWARRPLVVSRAAVAATLLNADADHARFIRVIGSTDTVVDERRRMYEIKATGQWSKVAFSNKRAFTHNLTDAERAWLHDNLATDNPDPLVVDITAGGGSIPFEAGRLSIRSYANDLNPVAALILRATCQWPQTYGRQLLEHYGGPITANGVATGKWTGIAGRFLTRVRELVADVYPEVTQPEWMRKWNCEHRSEIKNSRIVRAHKSAQTYLWARTIQGPSCKGEIPLSPNWRLDSKGSGVRLLPQDDGHCDFEIVDTAAEQSPGTVKDAIATCPWPQCGATTPRDYIAQQAQAGRLGHRLYAIIYRSQWQGYTKAGRPKKRMDTKREFAAPTLGDDNSSAIRQALDERQAQWDAAGTLPDEPVPYGNDNRPHNYGMSPWRNMFSPRQQLAMGCCVQAFRELVDEDAAASELDDVRKAAWCYLALALDKVASRNCLRSIWDPGTSKVASSFATHDFGMKWSYAEMGVDIRGIGLEWAIADTQQCISSFINLLGIWDIDKDATLVSDSGVAPAAMATDTVATESADFLLSLNDRSADAVIFDPPYYDNVSYAELSDFYYVWLKRTAGYIHPEWFGAYLTDKGNEAIASPARFRRDNSGGTRRNGGSVKRQAYEDYVARMRRIFAECRRVVKDDGIVTVMFTHKSTDAWDALTMGIIDAGFRVTATWPVKTESDSALNIRGRAAARSTILLVCRPKTEGTAVDHSWDQVKQEIADRVRERLPALESYGLRPLDLYLASFGPALEVISNSWPIRRARAHSNRAGDAAFIVTPNDALQVARREVFAARRRKISDRWANNPGDPLTEFYILAQDSAGSARMPFDEANMAARCVGIDLATDPAARQIYVKLSGGDIELLTAQQRFAQGYISEQAAILTTRSIDRVHIAIALADSRDVNHAIGWCRRQGFQDDAAFRGALEALLRIMKIGDPDREPARTLWSEMYGEAPPEPEGVQPELFAAA